MAACSRTDTGENTAQPIKLTAAPSSAKPDADATERTRTSATRLTIYSGDYERLASRRQSPDNAPGYVLVNRTLQYALNDGENAISATGLPAAMDVEAATLRAINGSARILSQRYLAPPSGPGEMLAAAKGKRVTVEHTSGGSKQTDSGTLVSAGDGLVLALSDGRIKAIRAYDSFSLIDSNALPPQQGTLRWTVQASKAGDAQFLLAYPMGGMAWRAEYLATLAAGSGCKLDLDGAALVANHSGTGFASAKLTLVAGSPNRGINLDSVQLTGARMQQYEAADAAPAAAMPVERTSGEYHAYELPGSFDVTSGSTERIPLFPHATAIACERAYETMPGGAGDPWQPPQPLIDPGFNDQSGKQPVKVTVALTNDKASGLDRPLPGGRVRVFDGADFLGESMLDHTAKGAEIRLEVGTAFDLNAERERTAFKVDRAGRTMTESFTITLSNAKDAEATVLVVEPVPRWSDWEITDSSVPARKRDAQRAEFAVKVPANGETKLSYSARYRWAPSVKP